MQTNIENLKPFIQQITSAPLPVSPGCLLEFYLGIELIRCEAATQICAEFIERQTAQSADTDLSQKLHRALEPIRLDLLKKYPDCRDMLDRDVWLLDRVH